MVIDVIMTILLILAIAFREFGITWHVLIGISLCILIVIHNILNLKWYKNLSKGKRNAFRNLSTLVNILFLAVMTVLFISSAFFLIGGGFFMRQIHVLSAYWGFVLMSIHIGMHGRIIILVSRKMFGREHTRGICAFTMRIIALCITAYGIKSSFDRNIGSKLIMYYSFDTTPVNESAIYTLSAYFSIMLVYIIGAHYMLMLLRMFSRIKITKNLSEI